MTRTQRCDIGNAIWLCATHSVLIDRDAASYPSDRLLSMKAAHEVRASEALAGRSTEVSGDDLIAIGPDVVCIGEVLQVESSRWTVQVGEFVMGDLAVLTEFCQQFAAQPDHQKHILVGSFVTGQSIP
jgi:hypothetical protein